MMYVTIVSLVILSYERMLVYCKTDCMSDFSSELSEVVILQFGFVRTNTPMPDALGDGRQRRIRSIKFEESRLGAP